MHGGVPQLLIAAAPTLNKPKPVQIQLLRDFEAINASQVTRLVVCSIPSAVGLHRWLVLGRRPPPGAVASTSYYDCRCFQFVVVVVVD